MSHICDSWGSSLKSVEVDVVIYRHVTDYGTSQHDLTQGKHCRSFGAE
jgi:hypothetical protein